MRHKITAPVKGFTGVVVGVQFTDGDAETENNNAVLYFRRHGYTVEPADGGQDGNPLNKWTVKQLKAYAEEQGIDLGEATKKDEILEAIAADAADRNEGEPGDGETSDGANGEED